MKSGFASVHPFVSFVYFAFILVLSMTIMHPAFLCISMVFATVYLFKLCGRRSQKYALLTVLPMMLLAAILNPAFNHRGSTILSYLPGGNPLTLESLIFGLASALMLGAVILWFYSFSRIITSEKLVFLFGKIAPALSLLLSMTLRFVPRFFAQLRQTFQVQKALLGDNSSIGYLKKIQLGLTSFSIVVTWSLESSVETADSMAARGYGLPGRTAFSLYRFTKSDALYLGLILSLGGFVSVLALCGGLRWDYFPAIGGSFSGLSLGGIGAFALVCALPLIIESLEESRWKNSSLKI